MSRLLTALLLLEVCLSTAAETPLTVKAAVSSVDQDGMDVIVTCNFSSILPPGMVGLVSLTISSRQSSSSNFSEMATVSSLREDIETAGGFEGVATGVVNNDRQGVSYVQVKFPSLAFNFEHEFQCKSTGINRFGHCINHEERTDISTEGYLVNITSTVEKIRKLQDALDIAQREVEECSSTAEGLLDIIVQSWEEQQGANFIWASTFVNNTVYVTLKDRDECTSLDGHLAEINSKEEFDFIKESVMANSLPSGMNFLLTGAYYSRLQDPFVFNTNVGEPMYLGQWASNEPHRSSLSYNWLLLKWDRDDKALYMADGTTKGSDLAYLCEIKLM